MTVYAGYDETRSPTWWEGWWAHAAGWGLPEGHTQPYRDGWRARDKLVNSERPPTRTVYLSRSTPPSGAEG